MNNKELLNKLKEENKKYVPDVRDKVVTSAKAEGLLELESDGGSALKNGNTAAAVVNKRRAVAISVCAAVAAVSLAIALPIVLTGNNPVTPGGPGANVPIDPSKPTDPDDPDDPVFPNAPVMEEMGLDYSVGAVSTVKLMQAYSDSLQPAARNSRAAVRSAESGIENFGIYFSAFDSFFSKDLLTARYSSHAGEHFDKTATICGKYPNGLAAEFVMNYCEALDLNTSTEGVYNYYLEGYIHFGYSDYALEGWRTVTVNGSSQTQTRLEISAYPDFADKTAYAKMQLTDKGYEFTVVTGGITQSEAVMYRPEGMQNTAYIVDIKGGNGGKFTVGMPSEGRNEVTVDYDCGGVKGQLFADRTDKSYGFVLCDYLIYRPSSDGSYYAVTGVNEQRLPESGKVVIPTYVGGKPVKEIASSAFYRQTSISSVVIPDCVETVSTSAFDGCSGLTEVVLPSGLKSLSVGVFKSCVSLESIKIPESVETIGASAFADCIKLTNFNIPDGVTSIGAYAFAGCVGYADLHIRENVGYVGDCAFARWDDLRTITVADGNANYKSVNNCLISNSGTLVAGSANSVIPNDGTVKRIADQAFARCKIASVTVPASVEAIGSRAFYDCGNLTQITLPETAVYIGGQAFHLSAYYLDKSNWDGGEVNRGTLYIGRHLLYATFITADSLVIKSGTLTIVDGAIANCKVKSIVFNHELQYIGNNVLLYTVADEISFDGENDGYFITESCLVERETGILMAAGRNAVIPNDERISIIGNHAFNGYNETTLVIPENIREIRSEAFMGVGYTDIVVNGELFIENFAFSECSVEAVTFNGGVSLSRNAFLQCLYLARVEINSHFWFGPEVFSVCPNLHSIYVDMTAEQWLEAVSASGQWYDDVADITVYCTNGLRLDKWGHII